MVQPPIPDPVKEGLEEKEGHHPKSRMRRQWEAAHAHDRQIMDAQRQHDEEEMRRDYRRRAASCFTTQNGEAWQEMGLGGAWSG